jgi:hypothetical protein
VHRHVHHDPRKAGLRLRAQHVLQRLGAEVREPPALLLQPDGLGQQVLADERPRGVGDGAVADLDAAAFEPALALL